jgi:hypothetical protein
MKRQVLFCFAGGLIALAAVLAKVGAAVSVTSATQAGIDCYKVTTSEATYYFDKVGGGFVSIIDKDGSDWVSWHDPATGPG